ncbi:energy-coupling factor transporter transmembrane component T family protein [Candidatus Contubernalis alkaliaceticus]|uniref:energy-coupling factor transporter transmembrane component T family protein n=1 Tax=Candidatus Contubernalis alkaliaceticus TaxID=338645 RepID=UPI001F4C07D2|nr:energy-coupling factor transporter transmembrane component T [Candidatus Contubernalis alkalaceticus]UNC93093.1 energy-coupling factor transporter transmembrane protein EcfT [Candidatus Contubernalis alkalaceticus]
MKKIETSIHQNVSVGIIEGRRTVIFLEGRQRGLQDMDPRMKILMSLVFSTMLFLTAQKLTMLISLVAAYFVLLLSGKGRTGIKLMAVYACFFLVDTMIVLAGSEQLKVLLGVFIYSVMKFIPIIMLGSWIASTVKVNEFIAAMEQMRLPRPVILPLAVMLRFLPTVKEELGYIRDTMKMRNIELSLKGILFHPLKTMEHILVPLLMRSVKEADELSAAALTRGVDGDNKRTTLRDVRILFVDVTAALLFITLTAVLWYLDKNWFAGFL